MRRFIEAIIRDAGYSLRQMFETPGFSILAVLTLAIGVGGVTAVFSFVQGVVLKPLPFHEPERLVRVAVRPVGPISPTRIPVEEDWDAPARQRVFEDVLRFTTGAVTLLDREDPVELSAPAVPIRFTKFLGVRPAMGRSFAPGDFSDPPSVAIVTHGFWTRFLGADPDAVGTPVRTDLGVITVIGVMPQDFIFYYTVAQTQADMFVPGEENGGLGGIRLARVRPGLSVDAAEAELARLVEEIRAEFPGSNAREVELIPLLDDAVGADWARLLLLFLAAVGFVLVIAVANVANLTLARSADRRREFAIRSAIGSTRSRLAGQFLVESLTLALVGGILGVLLAYGGLEAVLGLLPAGFPRASEVGIDGYVLLAALGAVLTAALVSGITQVFASSAPDLNRNLKDGDRGASDSASRRRFRSVLVGAQVALAAILLTGGILLARSFADLVGAPLGMDIANVVSVRPGLPASRYDPSARAAFRDALFERLRLHPGVEAVSASNVTGMSLGRRVGMTINGRPFAGTFEDATPLLSADAGIVDVLGLELAEGRWYREGEDTAAVVTGSFAARHYPDGSALGQEISWGGVDRTIVGVARDFRLNGPAEAPVTAVIEPSGLQSSFLVRTSGDPRAVMNAIRGEVRALDPEVVVDQTTLEAALYGLDAVSQARLRAVIVTAFAVVALLLSLAGIAGVASYIAVRRAPEIGVRLALGGTRAGVTRMMLRQTMMPVMAGIVAGALGAAALTRILSAYVDGLSTLDPVLFAVAAAILVVTAAVASYLPLRRVAAIHPAAALRCE